MVVAKVDPGRGANGRFMPGHQRNGGRRKGKKNKLTLDIKQAMLEAGADLGGDQGLKGLFLKAGKKDPVVLASWLANLIPKQQTIKTDEAGLPIENPHLTVNVIGVPRGTFLSKDEVTAIERRSMPEPLLIEHDDE